MKIQIYDTTLRDGTQGESVAFSVQDKLRVARKLDEFGINYIEGGWPGSNDKDAEFFSTRGFSNLAHSQNRRLRQHGACQAICRMRIPTCRRC